LPDVSCLGILVADVLARPVDDWPERGRLSLVETMGLHIGGCASNAAIDLTRLGLSVAALGKVGSDGFGDFVVTTLRHEGVNTDGILRDAGVGTSGTMVMVASDGERSFLHYIGANATVRAEDVNMEIIAASRLVHFAGALVMPGFDGDPAASVLEQAQAAGVTTCMDVVWDATGQWMKFLKPCLPHLDVFMPSFAEAREITGQDAPQAAAQALHDHGVNTVVFTLGEEGCFVSGPEGSFTQPTYQVNVLDGTGSGDAFAAGFIRGMLEGWSLEDCARLGNAVGALCCTALGTTAGVRTWDETLQFMEETPLLKT